jgi:hypothetical protein
VIIGKKEENHPKKRYRIINISIAPLNTRGVYFVLLETYPHPNIPPRGKEEEPLEVLILNRHFN